MILDGANSQKLSRTSRRFYRFTKTSVYRTIRIAPTAPSPSRWRNGDERNDKARMSNDERRPKSIYTHGIARRHCHHRGLARPRVSRISTSPGSGEKSAGEERRHPNRDRGKRALHRIWEISDGHS